MYKINPDLKEKNIDLSKSMEDKRLIGMLKDMIHAVNVDFKFSDELAAALLSIIDSVLDSNTGGMTSAIEQLEVIRARMELER